MKRKDKQRKGKKKRRWKEGIKEGRNGKIEGSTG